MNPCIYYERSLCDTSLELTDSESHLSLWRQWGKQSKQEVLTSESKPSAYGPRAVTQPSAIAPGEKALIGNYGFAIWVWMYDNNEMYARCELIARLDLKLTRALAIFSLFMPGDVRFNFPG